MVACNGPCLRRCAGGDAMTAITAILIALALTCFGAFIVALVWWWCNTATGEIDQADFDNEIHWHKYRDVQSKRGDL